MSEPLTDEQIAAIEPMSCLYKDGRCDSRPIESVCGPCLLNRFKAKVKRLRGECDSLYEKLHSRVLIAQCYDCGIMYGEPGFCDLVIDNESWKAISPDGEGNGLLCATCMIRRAEKAGLSNIKATFKSGPFCVEDFDEIT